MKKNIFCILFLICLGLFSRLIPHPWNFTALSSVSLFSGALLFRKEQSGLPVWVRILLSLSVPVAVLFLSDLVLGFYQGMTATYLAAMTVVTLGWIWSSARSPRLLQGLSLALVGSTLFFLMSNFAVWKLSGMYTHDLAGLLNCFALALPFFHWQVLGDVVYFTVCVSVLSYGKQTVFVFQKT